MFTVTVGNTFLKEYNKRNQTDFSPKQFYEDVFFEIFFNHQKYLWWVQNSPFVQGISKKKPFFEPEERDEKLTQLQDKIESGERDASFVIGYSASEIKTFATTSGLVTDIDTEITANEVYLSWIGGALIIGVSGGVGVLFDDPEICYETFEGWKVYRKYLNDPVFDRLLPNKITSWNGQWLAYKLGKNFVHDFNFETLKSVRVFKVDSDKIEIETVPWTRLFFSLSYRFPESEKLGNIFSLGQTNKTFGFFPFYLRKAKRLVDIYQKLFTKESYALNQNEFESLFGKHIKRSCELGSIGLQALEPKGLSKYFGRDSNIKLIKPDYSRKKNEDDEQYNERFKEQKNKDNSNLITFQTYKTWLIAMVTKNKEELLEYTSDIAKALVKYRDGARGTERKNLLEKQLFATTKKREFLKALNDIVSDNSVENDIIHQMKELRDRSFLMNDEDFVYLLLLLKFDYAYQERISNN